MITLKTKIENDDIISRGIAIIQFTNKAGAANALRNLPFEEKLGDQSLIKIEFYESKESRMLDIEMEEQNKHDISLSNLNPQFKKLVLSEPIQ